MPLPQAVARFNARYTNRFIEPIVARLPGFVVVVHAGRATGTIYRTPLYGFQADGDLLIALTYGPGADWVQNVAKTGGTIERNGTDLAIVSSTVVGRSAAWPSLPLVVRAGLRLLHIKDFSLLSVH